MKRSRLARKELRTIGKYSIKKYRCTRCGHEEMHGTNHWGEFYDRCKGCSWKNPLDPIVTWQCIEKMPAGYKKPEPWKKVRLGDVATIVELPKEKKKKWYHAKV